MTTQQRNRMGLIMAGLMLGIFAASIDNTIVSTAMGTIVSDLGGYDQFVWVTSAYLVTEMAGMPIFGKLSDMYGRKRFFVFGIALFILGSVLCGTASSIVELSIYRAIQGIGGGALMPISFAILFDVVPMEKRGSMSGVFGAVFGASSLFGPLLGAYIVDHIHWNWIFYINVPIGLASLLLVLFYYKESVEHAKQKIDWWGAVTLVGAVVCLMFALELGGTKYAWDSAPIVTLFASSAILFGIFLFAETKASEPIVSYSMFRQRLFGSSALASLFYGAGFIPFAMYIPIYVQGVHGGSATNSGLILLPLTLASVVAAQIGGFLAAKTAYRNIMIGSALIFILGAFLLSTITPDTSNAELTAYMIITGLGVGFSFSVLGMAGMHGFDASKRGAASSSMSFLRSLGMTVGLTVFGIVQRNALAAEMADAFGGGAGAGGVHSLADIRQSLTPEKRAELPSDVLNRIVDALSSSIAHMFVWVIVPAILALLAVLFMGTAKLKLPAQGERSKRAGAAEYGGGH